MHRVNQLKFIWPRYTETGIRDSCWRELWPQTLRTYFFQNFVFIIHSPTLSTEYDYLLTYTIPYGPVVHWKTTNTFISPVLELHSANILFYSSSGHQPITSHPIDNLPFKYQWWLSIGANLSKNTPDMRFFLKPRIGKVQ